VSISNLLGHEVRTGTLIEAASAFAANASIGLNGLWMRVRPTAVMLQ
jgi:hypothetical protein